MHSLCLVNSFAKEEPNKPKINDTGTAHINNVIKLKKPPTSIVEISKMISDGFPDEHFDELGPSTHREIIAKQQDEFEIIHQRLVPDKDAVTKEDRFSNKLSHLRPNDKAEYFGANDTDERSNLQLRNETRATKSRKTMAPNSSATNMRHVNSHRTMMLPSKTPTLYD